MILFLALGLIFAAWYIFVVDFHTHDHACFGIRFWKWKRKTKEIWFIKPNYQIAKHSHPNEEIELQYVFGKNVNFYRVSNSYGLTDFDMFKPSWKAFLKKFTVPSNTIHWFSACSWPLVFINHATWLGDTEPTSASIDFKEA